LPVIAILGGGFGLYGHLPAVVGLGERVSTLRRYESFLRDRPELSSLLNDVDLRETEDELLSDAKLVVLARRPADNLAMARRLLDEQRRIRFVIEKPIGPSPVEALILHDRLKAEGIPYDTPYLFLHSDWAAPLRTDDPIEADILWRFPLRNAGDSWKYSDAAGGGPLAYYFIHLLPIAALLGDEAKVTAFRYAQEQDRSTIELRMTGAKGQANFLFQVGDVAPHFAVSFGGGSNWASASPFGPMPARGEADPRIPVLRRFYASDVIPNRPGFRHLQGPALRLWRQLNSPS
jgi:hypothetical protein